jgi:hypothetical protein
MKPTVGVEHSAAPVPRRKVGQAISMRIIDVQQAIEEYQAACENLYRHELALHDAHQTGVDIWVAAAADRLHEAVVRRDRAAAALDMLQASA